MNNLNCTGTGALLSEDHHFLIWKVEDRGQRRLEVDKTKTGVKRCHKQPQHNPTFDVFASVGLVREKAPQVCDARDSDGQKLLDDNR